VARKELLTTVIEINAEAPSEVNSAVDTE